jgi:hypothetical protein
MRTRLALLALALMFVTATDADARGRRRSMGGEKYVANGTFGLGLELGSPTGLNGKYFLSDDRALNFGIGWIYDRYYYDDRDGLHLYLDYMFHPFSITNQPAFQLPFFIGVGGRIWDFDDRRGRDFDDGFALGVRCPIGIAFDFNNVPLDIFVQLTFAFDVFLGYRDRAGFHIEGSFGIRYWFD